MAQGTIKRRERFGNVVSKSPTPSWFIPPRIGVPGVVWCEPATSDVTIALAADVSEAITPSARHSFVACRFMKHTGIGTLTEINTLLPLISIPPCTRRFNPPGVTCSRLLCPT